MPPRTRPPALSVVRPDDGGDDARALELLHALAAGRPGLDAGRGAAAPDAVPGLLDARRAALVAVAGLIASGACAVTCGWAAQRARQAGATNVEIAAVLLAIGSTLGGPRLVEAAPRVAAAIGYDIEAAFEDAPTPGPAPASG